MPPSLHSALLRTALYADVFDYALTPAQLHHYLIECPASLEEVTHALATVTALTQTSGYFTLPHRAALAALRLERARHAQMLWPIARRWAARLSALPFVRMVAVTGALAMDNTPADDDIDFLIVTAPGRVWLTRALAVALVRLARLRGVGLCPNYVLSIRALAQDRRDLFTAHDLLQMVPLAGHAVYAQMRVVNRWADAFLPNAHQPLHCEPDAQPRGLPLVLQRLSEGLLSGVLGDALEKWERTRKLKKFSFAAQQPNSAALLDADRVKGHFNDNGLTILQKYQDRLALYDSHREPHGGEAVSSLLPGDSSSLRGSE